MCKVRPTEAFCFVSGSPRLPCTYSKQACYWSWANPITYEFLSVKNCGSRTRFNSELIMIIISSKLSICHFETIRFHPHLNFLPSHSLIWDQFHHHFIDSFCASRSMYADLLFFKLKNELNLTLIRCQLYNLVNNEWGIQLKFDLNINLLECKE